MKRFVLAISVLAVASVAASTAHAVNVCAYTVSGVFGAPLCPVRVNDTVCLPAATNNPPCDVALQCFAQTRTAFCTSLLRPKAGPQPQCPNGSRRPVGLRCIAAPQALPTRTPTPVSTTVNVTLKEFSVTPDQSVVSAGHVHFHVSNVGEDMHEFLVIRTDLPPDQLPTEANGSYEENGPGTVLLDEIDLVPSGESRDLDIDLAAGKYVLICNMVHVEENGEVEVHYQLGMRTAFTVQ